MADVTINLWFKVHIIGNSGKKAKSVGVFCNIFPIAPR